MSYMQKVWVQILVQDLVILTGFHFLSPCK